MADKIEVSPTPIQRNRFDVATDLTNLYYSSTSPASKEEVAETFLTFYATVEAAYRTSHKDLKEYMPESLKKII